MLDFIKKIIFKVGGISAYTYFYFLKKKRDIEKNAFEEPEIDIFKHFIKNGDDVFDIGSNYGHLAVVFSRLTPSGHIYAFEPIPFTHKVNEMILQHFNCKNVTLYHLGVGDNNEKVSFKVPKMDFGAQDTGLAFNGKRRFLEHTAFIDVNAELVALDAFLGASVKQLSFVKIDIEGAEYFALQGMKGLLQQFKPAIMIEICPEYIEGFGLTNVDLEKFLLVELGYEAYILKEKLEKQAGLGNSNYILIHSSKTEQFVHLMQ